MGWWRGTLLFPSQFQLPSCRCRAAPVRCRTADPVKWVMLLLSLL